MLSSQEIAEQWAQGMARSTEKMKRGAQNLTVSPAEKAIAAKDRYLEGVQRALMDGSYVRGLQKVSLASWQKDYLEKGVPRVTTGAATAKPKVQAHMDRFIPHLQAGLNKLSSMPRGTIDQNIARCVAMIHHNASFKS